ncbi:MAG: hypothetical protein PSV24_00425 [Rhodoferax sp.]|nr:hypothetical protein [Rhodoferax sp.]
MVINTALPNPVQLILNRINALGISYGREDSFKLTHRQLIQNRVLIGIDIALLPAATMFDIAYALGMPADCQKLLEAHRPQANLVLFGIEDRAEGSVCKLYLEFWDQVRREVLRTGSMAPQLLHLGVKWDPTRPNHHEVARYTCFPLLSAVDAMRRMASLYPQVPADRGSEAALGIVRRSLKANPAASLLYLEVSEDANPRCSFDINLYKTGLRVADAAPELHQAARQFDISVETLEQQLQRFGPCLLGHLSGGTDRHGVEFLSVYAETV